MFVAWLWLKMNSHVASPSSGSSPHPTATNICTSPTSHATTTTCWTHGKIGTVKSVSVELPCCGPCAGSDIISRCRRRQFKRWEKSKFIDRLTVRVCKILRNVFVFAFYHEQKENLLLNFPPPSNPPLALFKLFSSILSFEDVCRVIKLAYWQMRAAHIRKSTDWQPKRHGKSLINNIFKQMQTEI